MSAWVCHSRRFRLVVFVSEPSGCFNGEPPEARASSIAAREALRESRWAKTVLSESGKAYKWMAQSVCREEYVFVPFQEVRRADF